MKKLLLTLFLSISSLSAQTTITGGAIISGGAGGAAQIQSDWNLSSGLGAILNKPTSVSAFLNDIGYLTSSSVIPAANVSGLGIVATTNDYNSLINKPPVTGAAIFNVNGIALPVTLISANSCSATISITATGATTTSGINTNFIGDVSAITGWGPVRNLHFQSWFTTNTINFKICNDTASAITPGAVSVNFKVIP